MNVFEREAKHNVMIDDTAGEWPVISVPVTAAPLGISLFYQVVDESPRAFSLGS